MHELSEIVARVRASEEQFCLATVVDVVGSAYRRPGARMLIEADGTHIGSISGGCLEADLCSSAFSITEAGPRLIRFDTRSGSTDFNPRYNTGCSGLIYVLVQRVTRNGGCPIRYLHSVVDSDAPTTIATIYASSDVEPSIGSVYDDSNLPFLSNPQKQLAAAIWNEVESSGQAVCCEVQTGTGSIRLLIEKLLPRKPLWIFGAGDDAIPLTQFATQLGWNVTVIDHRASQLAKARFPGCRLVCRPWDQVDEELAASPETAAVLMTHSMVADQMLLPWVLSSSASYVGVLGPKNRVGCLIRQLHSEGRLPSSDIIARLHTPIGLDIGATTPAEISVSVLAEIIAKDRERSGGHLSETKDSIHHPVRHVLIDQNPVIANPSPDRSANPFG